LPRAQFLTALVTFNVGVEAGQLAVIAAAAGAVVVVRSEKAAYRRLIANPASALIGLIGIVWTVQRLL
jgi:hypothetical protein